MDLNWNYLAGFFDGEGSISVVRRKIESTSCVTVTFSQSSDLDGTAPPILVELSSLLDRHNIVHGLYEDKRSVGRVGTLKDGRIIHTRRVSWRVQIFNRAGCQRVLELLLPHLRVKRLLAQDVIRFLKMYGDMRGRFTPKRKVA